MDVQDSHLRVLFVDQITLSSLIRVWTLGRSAKTIWHFEPIAPSAQRWLRLFRRFGLVRAQVHQVMYHVGQIRDQSGSSEYAGIYERIRAICNRIKRERIAKDPLTQAIGNDWPVEKVLLYFDRLLEPFIRQECLRIAMVEWMVRAELSLASDQAVLLIKHARWFSYLQVYAQSQHIRLSTYGRSWSLKPIGHMAKVAASVAWGAVRNHLRSRQAVSSPSPDGDTPQRATVAIRYYHRKLSFDPAERSEFFWLHGTSIPLSETLLYSSVDMGLDDETLRQLKSRGIRLLSTNTKNHGLATWQRTPRYLNEFRRLAFKLIRCILSAWVHGQVPSLYSVSALLSLARAYAYWLDFFAANNVRVHVNPLGQDPQDVGMVMALDALGGISVAYQYSASNIMFPTCMLTAGENIQFVFSSIFEQLWRAVEAPVNAYVQTGYIYDSTIRAVQARGYAADVRRCLQENGAQFVLCFFDENSADRWDIAASDEDATRDYEFLLKWLLSDPTLGIVFKPKKSLNLFQRIARISGLIEQAKQSGRCVFLLSDSLVGNVFPAEAALAADVCFGKLLGSTAALEAHLAGVPTVLIDLEALHSHPFYCWGKNRVIFESWDALRAAVDQYRNVPKAHPEFGDWSPGLKDLDPFQDGEGSLRIGLTIQWLYQELKRGASAVEAIAEASEKFGQRWKV